MESRDKLQIIEGVEVKLDNSNLTFKGKNGEVIRSFKHPLIKISLEDNFIVFHSKKYGKRESMQIKTYIAHIKNLFKGVTEGHTYKLKVCSGHFPMNVTIKNNTLSVKNFLGEKIPRLAVLDEDVKIKQDGDFIILNGNNKETLGRSAGRIEQLCRISDKDRNRFQDGIYIIEKDGKVL